MGPWPETGVDRRLKRSSILREDVVQILQRVGKWRLILAALLAPAPVAGQVDATREAYFRAVAEFFSMTAAEVSILSEWSLQADEVPVVLFVARRAGVSPDALVALRRSGSPWAQLIERYHLGAGHFHVPLAASADPGRLGRAYERFAEISPDRWDEVRLRDEEMIDLVNLRIIAQTLRMRPGEVLARTTAGVTWVELYGRLIGGANRRPGVVR
jgi:hypothetical protein